MNKHDNTVLSFIGFTKWQSRVDVNVWHLLSRIVCYINSKSDLTLLKLWQQPPGLGWRETPN